MPITMDRGDTSLTVAEPLGMLEAGRKKTRYFSYPPVSYELDPCASMKARELAARVAGGVYRKGEDDDLRSIVAGITGTKGRVHVHFGAERVHCDDDPDQLAADMDREIHGGFRLFPTHLEAARRLGVELPPALVEAAGAPRPAVMACFEEVLAQASEDERAWILRQYAQPVRARLAMGPREGAQALAASEGEGAEVQGRFL